MKADVLYPFLMVETLGEAWSAGWRLRVRCVWGKRDGLKTIRECLETHDMDMVSLIWTRGREMPLTLLQDRLRCPRCGSRRVRVSFIIPSTSEEASARSAGSSQRRNGSY